MHVRDISGPDKNEAMRGVNIHPQTEKATTHTWIIYLLLPTHTHSKYHVELPYIQVFASRGRGTQVY